MQANISLNGPAIGFGLEPKPIINILMVYEDFASGVRAKETCNQIESELGGECAFQETMWKLNMLRFPQLRSEAFREAADADIVLLSLRQDDLAGDLKSWIESWLPQKREHPSALVALVDESPSPKSRVLDYLREVAGRGQMTFFAKAVTADTEVKDGSESAMSDTDFFRRTRPEPRWGINE